MPDFYCVGTPAQLRSFLTSVRTGAVKPRHKARICFSLDGSLLAVHTGSGSSGAAEVRPIGRNVRLLQVRFLLRWRHTHLCVNYASQAWLYSAYDIIPQYSTAYSTTFSSPWKRADSTESRCSCLCRYCVDSMRATDPAPIRFRLSRPSFRFPSIMCHQLYEYVPPSCISLRDDFRLQIVFLRWIP